MHNVALITLAAALRVTVSVISLAGCTSALAWHKASDGVNIVYPPGFTCQWISGDFGAYSSGGFRITYPHPGLDVLGDIVIAAADGRVRTINYFPAHGYQVALTHSPEDLGIPETYAVTWYSHLREADGKNSALKYVKAGERVARGQPIGEVGSTGTMSTYPHLHWTLYVRRGTWPREQLFRSTSDFGPDLANPHDWWAPHPKNGQAVRYIPFLKSGNRDTWTKQGFIFPILCSQ